jgi:hypothetical protein
MTQAEVDLLTSAAAIRGIHGFDARMFLGAKALLAANPNNRVARSVVEELTRQMATGEQPTTFALFMLPEFFTDEELAEEKRLRDEHLAHEKV